MITSSWISIMKCRPEIDYELELMVGDKIISNAEIVWVNGLYHFRKIDTKYEIFEYVSKWRYVIVK